MKISLPSDIAVIGYPSLCGGADTELLDQIKVWNLIGIKVHLIPTKDNKNDRLDLSDYNVVIHDYMDFSSCKDMHTLAFCNPAFLDYASEIRKYARSMSWANCMTFNFKNELEAHEKGYIDYFLYQTKHQYNNLAGNLIKTNKNYIPYQFLPYFDSSRFPFIDPKDRNYDIMSFGRISRSDIGKFSRNQFKIYSKINVPKQGIVLGWDDQLKEKFDSSDINNSNVTFYKENEITQQEFYRKVNVLCMSTNTYENLPRIGFEAMTSGTVLVVDNRGGWKTEIVNLETGYLCDNIDDFVYTIEFLYHHPETLKEIAQNARKRLETEFSIKKSVSSWLTFFNTLEKRN